MALENTSKIVESVEEKPSKFVEPTEKDKDLTAFIVDHTDKWREYRDQNFKEDWEKYERIFRGKWASEDKQRQSERSRVISPATQQAVETRHAEIIEGIFGQGEFFDIKDDIKDVNGNPLDVEAMKLQLYEDFAQDGIRKSFEDVELIAEITGTGIGEIVVSKEKVYYPSTQPINDDQVAYGVSEKERTCVKIVPVNPKNFLFDPNGTTVDDCMGVAVERYSSAHKIVAGIKSGKYRNVDISTLYIDNSLEATQETRDYEEDKILIMNYYGLVPREYLLKDDEQFVDVLSEGDELGEDVEDYADMVEAIIVIANGHILLKAEENPYMMKDRPIITYQDDTVPNRLLGRGTVEKAFNMQMAIDGSMRSHLDGLALTSAPMMGMDATRLPRGAKFEVKPGGSFMTNGSPSEILYPFKFGQPDGQSMVTSKEFERMLLMATATIDSNGTPSQVSRDAGGIDMASATLIKKYKRALTNRQENFIIPFIKKAAWRYMQFDPERYPSVDAKFIPTAALGIIGREYEQKQFAFLMQTLGADSPLTKVLMTGMLKSSSFSNKEQMLADLVRSSQPNPQEERMKQEQFIKNLQLIQSQIDENNAQAMEKKALAYKAKVEGDIAPEVAKSKVLNAISTNLPNEDDAATIEFNRRVKVAELMLKEEDVKANKAQVRMQMGKNNADMPKQEDIDNSYLSEIDGMLQ